MFRRKSRAIISLSGGPTGVMPLSSPSSPSVSSDTAIQTSLTINRPNNIQLASVQGFINGINGNIIKCDLSMTLANGLNIPMSGAGSKAFLCINLYNLALTLVAYNNQLKPNYLLKGNSIQVNDGGEIYAYLLEPIVETTISIVSNNPDGTTSSTNGSVKLDNISALQYMCNKLPMFSYGNKDPTRPSNYINLMTTTIIPLSIMNAICISIDLFTQDCLMFAPLLGGNSEITKATMFYVNEKTIMGYENACKNIPASNPQLASTVVASAANNTTTLQAQISTLTQSQSQLTQQLQATEASLSDITNKYNNTYDRLTQVQNQLSQTQSNDTSTINSLTTQTQSLQSQLNKLNGVIDSEINLYNTTKSSLDTANSQISSLQSQLKEESKLLDSLNSKLASDKEYIKGLYILLVILVLIIAVLVVKYMKRKGGSSSRINGGGLYSYNNNNWYNFM